MPSQEQKHVFMGMSGGIDSCASAVILIDQGYKVTGVTFVGINSNKNITTGKSVFNQRSSRKCCSTTEVLVAKNVCHSLGIQHLTLDLESIFEEKVKNPFVQSYLDGETPNPCMLCNRFVKLGALVEFALHHGADFVAMGHYSDVQKIDEEYLLKAGTDLTKDQSYFLALLRPEILKYLIFPLADKHKLEIRELVKNKNLPIQDDKVESQDICFIDKNYRDYLNTQGIKQPQGAIIFDKKIIGAHNGTAFFSLGQRRGLGVSVGKRLFVREIDPQKNVITLGNKPKSAVFRVSDLNIFSQKFGNGYWDVQIRYRSPRIQGIVTYIDQETIEVNLSEAQSLVTPGQYAVFYRNNFIYGAGKITSIELL